MKSPIVETKHPMGHSSSSKHAQWLQVCPVGRSCFLNSILYSKELGFLGAQDTLGIG